VIGIPEPVLRISNVSSGISSKIIPFSVDEPELNSNLDKLSVLAWIRPNYTDGSPEFTIISKENSFALSLNKVISPEKVAKFSVYDGISWSTAMSINPVQGWTHVAGVYNGTSLSVYLNGTLEGKLDTGSSSIAASTSNVTIGAYQNTLREEFKQSNYFSGIIDEITVYKDVLEESEIQEIFSNYTIGYSFPSDIEYEDTIKTPLNGTYVNETFEMSDSITLLLNNQTISSLDVSYSSSDLVHSQIEIGKSVNWTQTLMLNDTNDIQNILVELPVDAQNITIGKVDQYGNYTQIPMNYSDVVEQEILQKEHDEDDYEQISLIELAKQYNATDVIPLNLAIMNETNDVVHEEMPTKAILINDTQSTINNFTSSFNTTATGLQNNSTQQNATETEYKVMFSTPSPYTLEQDYSTATKFQRNVIVSHNSTLHYTNVKSFSELPEDLINKGVEFKLHWVINNSKIDVTNDPRFSVTLVDTDGNDIADRMEWVVPKLSEQEFQIEGIIPITQASHLDSNREFIEDIYPQVKKRDGIWTEQIPVDHFIRVTFDKKLASFNDITIYAKSNFSNSSVEVYEKDGTELIATFDTIQEDTKYKIFLYNLNGTADTFDLKIVGNPVEFDYIVDPYGVVNVTTDEGDASSFTHSHTVSGSYTLLIVSVATDSGVDISGVTYDGTPLNEDVNRLHGGGKPRVAMFSLYNPSSGANNVVVTMPEPEKVAITAISYEGVNPTTPITTVSSNVGSNDDPGIIISSSTYDIVQDAMGSISSGSPTVDGTQTERSNLEMANGGSDHYLGTSTDDGAASVPMGWTLGEEKEWVITAMNINLGIDRKRPTNDTASVDDTIHWTLTLAFGDEVAVDDVITPAVTYSKTMADMVLTDDYIKSKFRTTADTALTDDVITPTILYFRTIEDTVFTDDSISSIEATFSMTDEVRIDDSLPGSATVPLTDGVRIDDSLKSVVFVSLKDEVRIDDDSPSTESSFSLMDEVTTDDVISSPSIFYFRTIEDTVFTDDSLNSVVLVSLKDEVRIDDSLSIEATFSLTDEVRIDDSLNSVLLVSLKDEVRIDDSLSPVALVSLKDEVRIDDSLSIEATFSMRDDVMPADYQEVSVTWRAFPSDSVSTDDSLTRVILVSLKDEVLTDDSISTEASVSLKDEIAASDFKTVSVTWVVGLFDAVSTDDSLNSVLSFSLKDEVRIDDSLIRLVSISLKDEVRIIESETVTVTWVVALFDEVSIDDSISRVVTRSMMDEVLTDDSISAEATFSLTDKVTTSEPEKVLLTWVVEPFDAVLTDDSLSSVLSFSLKDEVLTDDSLSPVALVSLKDEVRIDDSLNSVLLFSLKDEVLTDDSISIEATFPLTDEVRIDDSLNSVVFVSLKDEVRIDDSLNIVLLFSLKDEVLTDDSISIEATFPLTDEVRIDDSLNSVVFVSLKDEVRIDDLLSATKTVLLEDSVSIQDIIGKTEFKSPADSVTVDDIIRVTTFKPLEDAVTVDDLLSATKTILLEDSVSIQDKITEITLRLKKDSATVDDRIYKTVFYRMSDQVTVDDVLVNHIRTAEDAVSVEDQISKFVTYGLNDSVLVDDRLTPALFSVISIDDSATVDDRISKTVFYRMYDEVTPIEDILVLAPVTFVLSDSAIIDDTIRKTRILPLEDSASISDRISKTVTYRINDEIAIFISSLNVN